MKKREIKKLQLKKNRIPIVALCTMLTMTLGVGCSNQIYVRNEKEKDNKAVEELTETFTVEDEVDSEITEEVMVEDTVNVTDTTEETFTEAVEERVEESVEESTEEEWEPFRFQDVYGNQFDTTIDPGVVKNNYDKSKFIRNGYKVTYEDENYTSRLGIDVSYYNGSIDWNQVKADGYEFVFIRVGNRGYGSAGSLNEDKLFKSYIKGAKEAGLEVGVYFFSQAINDEEALEEANYTLSLINGYSLDLPVVYDPEHIDNDTARTDDVSGEQFTSNSVVFLNAIRNAGYDAMIYTNMSWEAFEYDLKQFAEFPIWYADYCDKAPQTPYNFEYWQCTNKGRVAGITGDCDINIQLIKK